MTPCINSCCGIPLLYLNYLSWSNTQEDPWLTFHYRSWVKWLPWQQQDVRPGFPIITTCVPCWNLFLSERQIDRQNSIPIAWMIYSFLSPWFVQQCHSYLVYGNTSFPGYFYRHGRRKGWWLCVYITLLESLKFKNNGFTHQLHFDVDYHPNLLQIIHVFSTDWIPRWDKTSLLGISCNCYWFLIIRRPVCYGLNLIMTQRTGNLTI